MIRVTHIDGPMAGDENDVGLSAPRTPRSLSYAPCPLESAPFPNGYMLVDSDGLLADPEHPWPGQVDYALDRERSDLRPHDQYEGMEMGVAVYALTP